MKNTDNGGALRIIKQVAEYLHLSPYTKRRFVKKSDKMSEDRQDSLKKLEENYEKVERELDATMPPWYRLCARWRFRREYHNMIANGSCPFCRSNKLESAAGRKILESWITMPKYVSYNYTRCMGCGRVLVLDEYDKYGVLSFP